MSGSETAQNRCLNVGEALNRAVLLEKTVKDILQSIREARGSRRRVLESELQRIERELDSLKRSLDSCLDVVLNEIRRIHRDFEDLNRFPYHYAKFDTADGVLAIRALERCKSDVCVGEVTAVLSALGIIDKIADKVLDAVNRMLKNVRSFHEIEVALGIAELIASKIPDRFKAFRFEVLVDYASV